MTPQHFVVLLAYFKPWYWMGYRITGRERAMMLTKTGLSTYLLSHLNHVSSTLSSTFCLGVFMREAAATDSWTICSTESNLFKESVDLPHKTSLTFPRASWVYVDRENHLFHKLVFIRSWILRFNTITAHWMGDLSLKNDYGSVHDNSLILLWSFLKRSSNENLGESI